MDPTTQLENFSQSIYLMIKNRYYSNLVNTDPNSQLFLEQTVDWLNMYIDELQTEVTSDGDPIDWIWVRQPMVNLGTAVYVPNSQAYPSIAWNSTLYNHLCAGDDRFVQIIDSLGNILSQWLVVSPEELSNDPSRNDQDMCTVIYGATNAIMFNRPFNQAENGNTIWGDVTGWFPPVTYQVVGGTLTATNVNIFSIVQPLTLLKLGVAKNAILPDIVRGGLNPSYTQKYNDLLTNAINQSTRSAIAPTADYDDMTSIGGVGF